MKKIRRAMALTVWLAAIMLLALACNDDLDIRQAYVFDLEAMPVPKKVAQDETVEIRCRLIKEGDYQQAKYFIRMFQVDGKGELRMENKTLLKPNDLYPLEKEVFRLYYTSRCKDQQTVDIYIEDSFGQVVQKTFSFQNVGTDDKEEGKSQKLSINDYSRLYRVRPLLAIYSQLAEKRPDGRGVVGGRD